MAFPNEVLEDIERGKAYYSDLNAEYIVKLTDGCGGCTCEVKNYQCLKRILRSLDFKVELDEYDDIAKKLVNDMLIIIGDYVIKYPPTVDAGSNQSVPIDETAVFNATITPGSAAITNIQWTIVSGTGTLTGANTANVSVTDFVIGNTVLKITVTDANGLMGVDTVTLTGTEVIDTVRVYYLFQDTNAIPNEATILASSYVDVVTQSSYVVPINSDNVKYILIYEPITEPLKVRWLDTLDPDNNGVIQAGNTFQSSGTVGAFRGYITGFKTQFNNPIRFIKSSTPPVEGFWNDSDTWNDSNNWQD